MNKFEKSGEHKVNKVFSGKSHIFDITSPSGEIYDVAIQVSCTCRYMSVQGIPNGKLCSHIIAAMKELIDEK